MRNSRTIWITILLSGAACGDDGTNLGAGTSGSSGMMATGSPTTGMPTGSETTGVDTGSSTSEEDGSTTTTGSATTGSSTGDTDSTTGSGSGSSSGSGDSSTSSSSSSSSGAGEFCGDGEVNLDEECDDGDDEDGNGCDNDCTESVVVALSAGDAHTCATLDTGVVRCWGENFSGALGVGSTVALGDNEPPSSGDAAGLGVGIAMVSSGFYFNCALTLEDTVRCWGRNDRGQLAYGNIFDIGDDELPGSAGNSTLTPGNIVHVSTGAQHACAAYDDGEVACWGTSNFGEGGYANYDMIGDDEPVSDAGFVDVPGDVVQLALGERHTCARLDTGAVQCWGYGLEGALGYGNFDWIGDDEHPSSVGPVNVPPAIDISAASNHTCIVTDGGEVWCWGRANAGLGYETTLPIGNQEEPIGAVDVGDPMAGLNATQVVSGTDHICALLSDGTVFCWGDGGDGRLGYGNTDDLGDDEPPTSQGPVDVGGPVQQLAAGHRHTCALLESGSVRCWGWGWSGRLGYGNLDSIGDDETPASAGDVPLF